MSDSVLSQLHRSLVDAMRRSRPGSLHRPVTVAEIYQDLVPYRDARTLVGFEMNADYEHALLRLLAGEGDLARIEPSEVRDKLRMELDSPNPNVGVFRNYAACDVWVNVNGDVDDVEIVADDDDAAESWEEEFVGSGETPEPRAASPRFEIATDESEPEEVADEPARVREVCAFCSADLPTDKMVNFCPYCGTDQSQRPCPSCGEILDPLWRFCVSCGARVRPLGDHVN